MIKAFEKHKILIPITAVVLFIIAIIFMAVVTETVLPDETIPLAVGVTVFRILISAAFIIIIKKLFGMKIGFGRNGLAKGIFVYGLFICIAAVSNFIGSYLSPEKSFIHALPLLILFFIGNMSVGVMEEILCRGLLFNSFKEYFGDSKKGIYISVFLSAAVFGAVHITNLIFTPDLVIATTAQVIYAFFFGVLFAVIYYRTKNILPCIILHGVFDFTGSFWMCFANDIDKQMNITNTTDMDIVSALIIIGLNSMLLISALWQLRKIFNVQQTAVTENTDI